MTLQEALLHFRVDGVPIPQGSLRSVGNGVIISDNPKLSAWRKEVKLAAQQAYPLHEPTPGPFSVVLIFTLPRPKSVSERSRPHHTVKPDLDKLIRACFDAFTEAGVWRDDAEVVTVLATKAYETPTSAPGCEVRIEDTAMGVEFKPFKWEVPR